MFLRIEQINKQLLIGKFLTMNFSNNRTFELWKSFMPKRKEIQNQINTDLISMQVFPADFDFINFDIDKPFEKWAAVIVSEDVEAPADLYKFTLAAGTYAVFLHRGPASTGEKTFRYIFEEWLPSSGFVHGGTPPVSR